MSKNPENEAARMRTLLDWTNYLILRKGDGDIHPIREFESGLSDGTALYAILFVLFSSRLPNFSWKIDKKPKNQFVKIANLNQCFDFLKQLNFRSNIASQDIFEGKDCKSLIWALVRFIFETSFEGGIRKAILHLNERCQSFGVKVKDFSQSWDDGLMFCALMASMHSSFNYASCLTQSPEQRMTAAFEFAHSQFGLPELLTVDQILLYDDEESILTFLSLLMFTIYVDPTSQLKPPSIEEIKKDIEREGKGEMREEEERKFEEERLREQIERARREGERREEEERRKREEEKLREQIEFVKLQKKEEEERERGEEEERKREERKRRDESLSREEIEERERKKEEQLRKRREEERERELIIERELHDGTSIKREEERKKREEEMEEERRKRGVEKRLEEERKIEERMERELEGEREIWREERRREMRREEQEKRKGDVVIFGAPPICHIERTKHMTSVGSFFRFSAKFYRAQGSTEISFSQKDERVGIEIKLRGFHAQAPKQVTMYGNVVEVLVQPVEPGLYDAQIFWNGDPLVNFEIPVVAVTFRGSASSLYSDDQLTAVLNDELVTGVVDVMTHLRIDVSFPSLASLSSPSPSSSSSFSAASSSLLSSSSLLERLMDFQKVKICVMSTAGKVLSATGFDGKIDTRGGWSLHWSHVPSSPGQYQIAFFVGKTEIRKMAYEVRDIHIKLDGDRSSSAVVGRDATFLVMMIDLPTQQVVRVGETLEILILDNLRNSIPVKTEIDQEGICNVHYTPHSTGVYSLIVRRRENTIHESMIYVSEDTVSRDAPVKIIDEVAPLTPKRVSEDEEEVEEGYFTTLFSPLSSLLSPEETPEREREREMDEEKEEETFASFLMNFVSLPQKLCIFVCFIVFIFLVVFLLRS